MFSCVGGLENISKVFGIGYTGALGTMAGVGCTGALSDQGYGGILCIVAD